MLAVGGGGVNRRGDERAVVARFGDLRRHVAVRAFGGYRVLYALQALVEDVVGAVEAGQLDTAAYVGRGVVLEGLSIRSLAAGGGLASRFFDVTFDPFSGVDEDTVADAMALASDGFELAAAGGPAEEAGAWAARIVEFARGCESVIGYREPLPVLRSPGGLFPALRLARDWPDVLDDLRLPPVLPREWTEPTGPAE